MHRADLRAAARHASGARPERARARPRRGLRRPARRRHREPPPRCVPSAGRRLRRTRSRLDERHAGQQRADSCSRAATRRRGEGRAETIYEFLSPGSTEAQYHEGIHRLMTRDGLTEAHNRTSFEPLLGREISRARRHARARAGRARHRPLQDHQRHLRPHGWGRGTPPARGAGGPRRAVGGAVRAGRRRGVRGLGSGGGPSSRVACSPNGCGGSSRRPPSSSTDAACRSPAASASRSSTWRPTARASCCEESRTNASTLPTPLAGTACGGSASQGQGSAAADAVRLAARPSMARQVSSITRGCTTRSNSRRVMRKASWCMPALNVIPRTTWGRPSSSSMVGRQHSRQTSLNDFDHLATAWPANRGSSGSQPGAPAGARSLRSRTA